MDAAFDGSALFMYSCCLRLNFIQIHLLWKRFQPYSTFRKLPFSSAIMHPERWITFSHNHYASNLTPPQTNFSALSPKCHQIFGAPNRPAKTWRNFAFSFDNQRGCRWNRYCIKERERERARLNACEPTAPNRKMGIPSLREVIVLCFLRPRETRLSFLSVSVGCVDPKVGR